MTKDKALELLAQGYLLSVYRDELKVCNRGLIIEFSNGSPCTANWNEISDAKFVCAECGDTFKNQSDLVPYKFEPTTKVCENCHEQLMNDGE